MTFDLTEIPITHTSQIIDRLIFLKTAAYEQDQVKSTFQVK